MVAVGSLSTVLSDTGTTVVAMPMIMAMCVKARLAPARILMPVAFASSLGGTVTLVGTPPNGIINAMLGEAIKTNPDLLLRQFGFFEYGWIGIPLLIAGWIWFPLIGYKLLPKNREIEDASEADDVARRYSDRKSVV